MQPIVFAKRLTMVATDVTAAQLYTDPVPLGTVNVLSAIPVVHYSNGPAGGVSLMYTTQVSNDGENWRDQGPTDTLSDPADGAQTQQIQPVNGGYVRVWFHASVGATGTGAICFCLFMAPYTDDS